MFTFIIVFRELLFCVEVSLLFRQTQNSEGDTTWLHVFWVSLPYVKKILFHTICFMQHYKWSRIRRDLAPSEPSPVYIQWRYLLLRSGYILTIILCFLSHSQLYWWDDLCEGGDLWPCHVCVVLWNRRGGSAESQWHHLGTSCRSFHQAGLLLQV